MKIITMCCLVLFLIVGAGTVQGRNLPPPNLCDSTAAGILEWKSQYRFDPCHTGFNVYEYILSPSNVGSLVQAWQYTTGDQIFFASPTVANGVVYTGSDDQNVYALNASTGALLWRYTTAGLVHSSPAVANGTVYVGSDDHKLYALNAASGVLKWTYSTGNQIYSSPTVNLGVVYVLSSDGLLSR